MNDDIGMFRQVLRDEAKAIVEASERIQPEAVDKAVDLIANCHGKMVFTGVGKSGLIARKTAATFSSLNLPAIFLHATEAVHGDLGIVTKGDIALMLSNSGETDELLQLIPHLHGRQVPIISIVGNPKSTMARESTVVIDASVSREVCFLNLAPTSSTTLALAIGDALATVISHKKNLSRNEFALNHPSGRLGKRLTLKVSDFIRSTEGTASLRAGSSWREVVIALSEYRLGAVNIVDDDQRLLGLITDGDLRRVLSKTDAASLDTLSAEQIMTKDPKTVKPESLAYDALLLMNSVGERGVSVLSVVDAAGKTLGLLRLQDLIKAGI